MKIKLATIGTSGICSLFIDAAKQSGKYELKAVYSRNEETGQAFAKRHNAELVYTDLEKLASSSEIDTVYIASPNGLHFEQAKILLKSKKHIICEKPIFSTVKELDEAFQLAEENGVYLFEAVRNIHDPNFAILQKELPKVGTIQNVFLQFCQYSSRYDKFLAGEEPNVFSLKYSGGALVDLGVYPLNLAVQLFGEPKNSTYLANKLRNGIDGSGTLVLAYEGFQCTILTSKISASQMGSEIQGVNGSLILGDTTSLVDLTFVDRKSLQKTKIETTFVENNMIYEAKVIADAIQNEDLEMYRRCKRLSKAVLQITEKSRHQNGIFFDIERSHEEAAK